MDDEVVTVRCVCGWEATGTEDEVVPATVAHGQAIHNMTATREQVLAMAVRPDVSSQAADSEDPAEATR